MRKSQRKTALSALAFLAAAGLALSAVAADQEPAITAMTSDPCAGVVVDRFDPAVVRPMLEPGFKPPSAPRPMTPEAMAALDKTAAEKRAKDFANLCRYRAENSAVVGRPSAVFIGGSITEAWPIADPELFGAKVISRGIGGQTTPQMLLRFRADVLALRPAYVHIMAGTNDIAGNTGPTSEADFQNNIMSMVELAKANGVRVVLASIPPMDRLGWRPSYRPAAQVQRLNAWLRDYARRSGVTYVDYYSVLSTPAGAMKPELTPDGVHPNVTAYRLMRPLAKRALGLP